VDKQLEELLDLIEGKTFLLTRGITTYPDRDDNNRKLHACLLELEKLGKVKRHLEKETHIVWMPTGCSRLTGKSL